MFNMLIFLMSILSSILFNLFNLILNLRILNCLLIRLKLPTIQILLFVDLLSFFQVLNIISVLILFGSPAKITIFFIKEILLRLYF